MRDVETASEKLARAKNNEEYFVPISRLSDFETRGVIPSIYRLQALATIYRLNASYILSLYGVNFDLLPTRIDVSAADSRGKGAHLKRDEQGSKQDRGGPPVAGCYLLDLILPRKHRESLIGDIEEDYRTKILPRYGRTAASVWFWKQVIVEIVPGLYLRIITSFLRRHLGV